MKAASWKSSGPVRGRMERGLVGKKGKEARRPEGSATDLKTRRLEEGEVESVWTC